MSFDISSKRPKLVEGKVVKFFNDRKEAEKEIEIITASDTWYENIKQYLLETFKENWGFFILIILVTILLWVRYIEVNNRKEKIKKALLDAHVGK